MFLNLFTYLLTYLLTYHRRNVSFIIMLVSAAQECRPTWSQVQVPNTNVAWNSLPPSVVNFTSLRTFKRTIVNPNLKLFTKYSLSASEFIFGLHCMCNFFLLSCVTVSFILVCGMSVALPFACHFQIKIPQSVDFRVVSEAGVVIRRRRLTQCARRSSVRPTAIAPGTAT